MMKVLKFGGTSVGSAERMKNLLPLIINNEPKIVVLSAMSGTTNSLVEIAATLYEQKQSKATELVNSLEKKYDSVIKDLYATGNSLAKAYDIIRAHFATIRSLNTPSFSKREEKILLAQGELVSTALFHCYLEDKGIPAVFLLALNFMHLDQNDEPNLPLIKQKLAEELALHKHQTLFITQGYICRNILGEIDNLQRGGSDYTATLIGAAMPAEEIQIWTDIDGMHNNDPRIVEKTFPITELSFDEAAELAYFGAKILHPTCILPAQKQKVPVRLLNTLQPTAKGTLIADCPLNDRMTAIAAKDGLIAITIKSDRMLLAYGFLKKVFEIFERYKTPIDMITTSEVAVSLTIDSDKNIELIKNELEQFCTVKIEPHQTIVCVVGNFSADKQGGASRVFDSIKNIPIRMISYGGSENNISLLIDSKYKKEALTHLNKGLFNL
jgi:aspartate kinase